VVYVGFKVENKVLKGPDNDLGGFLEAVDQLQHNVEFFTLNRSLKASDGALNHARNLLNKGMSRLADEFKALLTQHRFVVLLLRIQWLCFILIIVVLVHFSCYCKANIHSGVGSYGP
jgi:hypothetical protein